MVLFFLALACCAVVPACVGPGLQHVAAERATYDWFAPRHARYVAADPTLDDAAKATHLRALDAWGARVRAEEAAAGMAAVPLPAPGSPPPAAAAARGGGQ